MVSCVRSRSRACSRSTCCADKLFRARTVATPIADRLTRHLTRGVPALRPCGSKKLEIVSHCGPLRPRRCDGRRLLATTRCCGRLGDMCSAGKVTHKLLRTIFPPAHERNLANLLRADRWEGELVHSRRDGRQVVVSSRWSWLRDTRGRHDALLLVQRQILSHRVGLRLDLESELPPVRRRNALAPSRFEPSLAARLMPELGPSGCVGGR